MSEKHLLPLSPSARPLPQVLPGRVPHRLALARLAPLIAALALAGCASITPRRPAMPAPPALPAALPAPASATVRNELQIDRWWLAFDDAELHRLIEQALARNTDLAIAAARLREAAARFAEARGAQKPSVDVRAESGRARVSADAAGAPAARTGSSHEVALVGQYEVDLWGRLAAGGDAARSQLAAQAWARAAVQWSLSAQLAEAHFTLRALERQMQIAQAVRASRARSAELRGIELRAGAVAEFELRRAEAELAAAESSLASLQRRRLSVEATLALLTGEPTEQLGQAPAPRTALDAAQVFEPRLPAGTLAEMLQRRPDVRQAEAQLATSHADVQGARAAALPALRLTGSVGSDVRDLGHLFSAAGFAWSLAAGLTQSVFDGGRNTARIDQAEARADVALAQYRRSVATALVEVREAYAALDVQQRAWVAERQRVTALERAHRLAELGRQAGAMNQLDALDAERNHFNAQLAEVDAYRERLVGQVAVFKALGGGHAGADPQPRGGHAGAQLVADSTGAPR